MGRLMKHFWITFFIALPLFHAQAQGLSRVDAHLAHDAMQTRALETQRGRFISIKDVVSAENKSIKRVLQSQRLDLSNGEVIYPEEIRYLIIEVSRPPRENERAPRDHN